MKTGLGMPVANVVRVEPSGLSLTTLLVLKLVTSNSPVVSKSSPSGELNPVAKVVTPPASVTRLTWLVPASER